MIKGDSVIVTAGIKDPDWDTNISGWRGRAASVHSDGTVAIAWDSGTLDRMGLPAIMRAESEGLDWTQIVLMQSEVQIVPPADTEADVEATIKRIRALLK